MRRQNESNATIIEYDVMQGARLTGIRRVGAFVLAFADLALPMICFVLLWQSRHESLGFDGPITTVIAVVGAIAVLALFVISGWKLLRRAIRSR